MAPTPSPKGTLLASAALLGMLFASPAVRRDLDVGIPPGSALDWGQLFPGVSPPRVSYLSNSKNRKRAREAAEETTRSVGSIPLARPMKAADSTPILSIFTWDIPLHLTWIDNRQPQPKGPTSDARTNARPAPPVYGDTMYWTTLAPLFRILLHPRLVSRAGVIAHMLELGDACLPALTAASNDSILEELAMEIIGRLRPRKPATVDYPELEDTPRSSMLKRFARAELLRHEPYDVTSAFGARLFLLSDVFFPIIADLAAHSSHMEVRRNAVSALVRYDSKEAAHCLLRIAESSQDQVVLARCLNGLGRYARHVSRSDWGALNLRLQATSDPVLRVAMIGALGRAGALVSFEHFLESLEASSERFDADELQALLLGLFSMVGSPRSAPLTAALKRLDLQLSRSGAKFKNSQSESQILADIPEASDAHVTTLKQLITLLQSKLQTDPKKASKLLYSLVGGRSRMSSFHGTHFQTLLNLLGPTVRIRFLTALAEQRDAEGLAFLTSLVRLRDRVGPSESLDPADNRISETSLTYGSIALGVMPPAERIMQAHELLKSEESILRLMGLDQLLNLGDGKLESICRELLEELKGVEMSKAGAATKKLYQKALQELSRRSKLTPQDALGLQVHLKDEQSFNIQPSIKEQVKKTLSLAANHAPKTVLRREIKRLIQMLPQEQLFKLLEDQNEKQLNARILQFHIAARGQSIDAPYLAALEQEILDFLSLRPAVARRPQGSGITFEPPVNLQQTILLSMGEIQHPMITELINNALNSKRESIRARACIALGMTQDKRSVRRLLPALASRDPFTRLCAAQAMHALDDDTPFFDWLYSPIESRKQTLKKLQGSASNK